jgi:hypothetical protein
MTASIAILLVFAIFATIATIINQCLQLQHAMPGQFPGKSHPTGTPPLCVPPQAPHDVKTTITTTTSSLMIATTTVEQRLL